MSKTIHKGLVPLFAAGALLICAFTSAKAYADGICHVHIRNRTDHHLKVFVDNQFMGECDPHTEDLTFDIDPGNHQLYGTEEHGREQARTAIRVVADERFRWTVYNDHHEHDDE